MQGGRDGGRLGWVSSYVGLNQRAGLAEVVDQGRLVVDQGLAIGRICRILIAKSV